MSRNGLHSVIDGGWAATSKPSRRGSSHRVIGSTNGPVVNSQWRTAQLPDGTQLNVVYNSGTQLATFDVDWGSATYTYRLPVGAAAIFTTRSAA